VENRTSVDPSSVTIAEYLRGWLDADTDLSPKTKVRYRELVERQIVPHLGAILLQKLRPSQVHDWHSTLLKAGGTGGKPLSARTVGHAHRMLHRGLERAMGLEIISRNVAHPVRPPMPEAAEIEILSAEQISEVLTRLADHSLHPIVALALGTVWPRMGAIDLDAATVRVERSLEETAAGLRLKPPKTRHGRRTISLPAPTLPSPPTA
jgi:integrase